ncbi:MAG: hypothetical protein R6V84_13410 [Desulfobacterales bacterium]
MVNYKSRISPLSVALLLLFAATGCTGSWAKIRSVESPRQMELRTGWQNYHTYCLGSGHGGQLEGQAMLFQLKGDKTIQKSVDWREVTSDQMASSCAVFMTRPSPVMQLRGENNEVFGYIIYDFNDSISASVIDPKTIRLFYHVNRKGGGP